MCADTAIYHRLFIFAKVRQIQTKTISVIQLIGSPNYVKFCFVVVHRTVKTSIVTHDT